MASNFQPPASSSAASATPVVYVFGPFRLIPSERRLLRAGIPVELTPKAFDTLVVLVHRAGQLVTKDALMDAVWPETVVEANYLSVNISKIRTALARRHAMPSTSRPSSGTAIAFWLRPAGRRCHRPVRWVPESPCARTGCAPADR